MENYETQFLIMLEHYKAKEEKKRAVPDQSNNKVLSKIDEIDYRINYGNLAELGLIQTDKSVNNNDQLIYTATTGISESGLCLVVQFMDICIKDHVSLDNEIRPHLFNLFHLEMMWDENENKKLYQKHIQVMTSLIRAIN